MGSPLPLLGRGLTAGGIAGAATGLFSLLFAEPLMDRAVRLEEARSAAEEAHAHGGGPPAMEHHAELFSRGTQHVGLLVTAVVTGLAIGVFFAIVHALVHRSDPGARPWPRALTLAAAGFAGVALLPFLRYPANPPGVGDPGTVSERTTAWLAAVVIGVLGMVLAHQVYARLGARGVAAPLRQTAVALTALAVLVALFALPDDPDPVPVPATLLWDFRVLSLGSQVLLWAVLGGTFGALGLRAAQRTEAASAAPSAASAIVTS